MILYRDSTVKFIKCDKNTSFWQQIKNIGHLVEKPQNRRDIYKKIYYSKT